MQRAFAPQGGPEAAGLRNAWAEAALPPWTALGAGQQQANLCPMRSSQSTSGPACLRPDPPASGAALGPSGAAAPPRATPPAPYPPAGVLHLRQQLQPPADGDPVALHRRW
jgi:hypothetical protein